MHAGKSHGLKDCINYILSRNYSLVLTPDSSSNDYTEHTMLKNAGIDCVVLDHHLAEKISEDAVIVNNQLCDYPNKEFCGAGVVWQFCRYLDDLMNVSYANEFLDLLALALTADMMSMRSFETKYLINKGFRKENIKNPFIDYMIDKNSFALSKSDYISAQSEIACTPMGAAFFIVPFVNAMTRSGTIEEKNILFMSMLEYKAFDEVLSNKRGHYLNEKEKLVIQAIRTATNVKNRQTRAEEEGLKKLEKMITTNHMLQHKVLLFLLKPDEVPGSIRGLIANKMMAKYQRPCCVLTYNEANNTYDGSGRGYTKTGIDSFKEVLDSCPEVIYAEGHDNAFGISIIASEIDLLLERLDRIFANVSSEPIYRIDYDFKENEDNTRIILAIAAMNDYWGQDIERAYVNINFKITKSNLQLMKNNTIKISLPHGLSIIKFKASEEQIEALSTQGYLEVNAICKCNKNEWDNRVYPQLVMQDYEVIDSSNYYF